MRLMSTCKYLLVVVLAVTAGITLSASVGYFPEAAAAAPSVPPGIAKHRPMRINATSAGAQAVSIRAGIVAGAAVADPECTELCLDGPILTENCTLAVVAAEVNHFTVYKRYWNWPVLPKERVELRITSTDRSIMEVTDAGGNARSDVIVAFEPGQIFSSLYGNRGVKVGQANEKVEPFNEAAKRIWKQPWEDPSVIWQIDNLVDYNDMGGTNTCYDPINSPALHSDPNVWITCGTKAKNGVVTDGSSRQFLRVKAGGPGRVCFRALRDPNPPNLDPGTTSLNAAGLPEFETQLVDTTHWVHSLYTPPKEFETPDQITRKVRLQVGYTPKNPDGSYNHTSTYYSELKDEKGEPIGEITLHRPPVLLVHGLWSNSKTWSSGYVNPAPAEGRLVDSEFDYPNAAPFASSIPDLQERIKTELIGKLRKKEIAATQVDLIAHSMGTLLSRSWLTHSEYRRPDNFNEGDVRKLASLTAPHWGTQFANLLINLHQKFPHGYYGSDTPNPIDKIESSLTGDIHLGAICGLAENSPSLAFSGAPAVLGRAHTASAGPIGIYWAFNSATSDLSGVDYNDHVRPYWFTVPNDALVAVDSQQAGLPSSNDSGAIHFHTPGILGWYPFGLGITDSTASAKDIYAQLDSSQGFFQGLPAYFPPYVDGRTRLVGVGRGIEDVNNFSIQCASSGGPMNPGISAAAMQRAQAVKVAASTYPSAQPGISITPVSGSVVRPSESVPFSIVVDPALQAQKVQIWASMKYGIVPVDIPTPPYETSITIPTDLSGPIEMYVTVYLPDNKARTVSLTLYVIPADAPIKLEVTDTRTLNLPPKLLSALSRRLSVIGVYADGTRRDLRGAALGTAYTSTSSAVATVDSEGVVMPVAPGIAFIVTDHRGMRAYTEVEVIDPSVGYLPAIDQTGNVSMVATGFQLNRELGRYIQSVTITNTSALPLPKPLKFVISGLPSGVELTVDDGKTRAIAPIGSPYRSITFDAPFLLPGASQTITLGFTNNYGVPITYTARLYTASRP